MVRDMFLCNGYIAYALECDSVLGHVLKAILPHECDVASVGSL